jgi:hypothetical protein
VRAAVVLVLLAGCTAQAPVALPGDGPQMRAEVPGAGVQTVLTPAGQNGDTVTWLSPDGVSLAFQDGVLVASRGLPGDLMSADARATRAALLGGPVQDYTRFMSYLDRNGATQFRSMVCDMGVTGPERFGSTDTLRHDEDCASLTARVTNSYWVGGDGTVWQSRQWIGDEAGYLVTQRLIQ